MHSPGAPTRGAATPFRATPPPAYPGLRRNGNRGEEPFPRGASQRCQSRCRVKSKASSGRRRSFPGFDCTPARLLVQKKICASPKKVRPKVAVGEPVPHLGLVVQARPAQRPAWISAARSPHSDQENIVRLGHQIIAWSIFSVIRSLLAAERKCAIARLTSAASFAKIMIGGL